MVWILDHSPSFEEILSLVLPSTVAIAVGQTTEDKPNIVGTGFALSYSEFFATCWHVAKIEDELSGLSSSELSSKGLTDNKLRIGFLNPDGEYFWRKAEKGTFFRTIDEANDICIYRVVGVSVPPLDIIPKDEWALGAEVGIVGFPGGISHQGVKLRAYVLKTIISSAVEWPLPSGKITPRLALGIAVAGGFSGGPVVSTRTGHVVGMISSKTLEGNSGQKWPTGISLAVTPILLRQTLKVAIEGTTTAIKEGLISNLARRNEKE